MSLSSGATLCVLWNYSYFLESKHHDVLLIPNVINAMNENEDAPQERGREEGNPEGPRDATLEEKENKSKCVQDDKP